MTITAGESATTGADGSRRAPKKDLVGCLQVLLQSRRLRTARALPDAATLVRELENYRVRVTAAAWETFGAGPDAAHDDLVVAVALACWWAERGDCRPFDVAVHPRSRLLTADAPPGVFYS